jgi:hypothetical protein
MCERAADQIERAAARMQAVLDWLRTEPDIEKRRALFFSGIPEFAALDLALANGSAKHGGGHGPAPTAPRQPLSKASTSSSHF